VESCNGNLRDELLARNVFDAVLEAKALIERWWKESNSVRRPPPPALLSQYC